MKAVPEMGRRTKGVRCYNVKVGDELSFFDTKARRERIMVVRATMWQKDNPRVISLTLTMKRARHPQERYVWRMARHAVVRIRRAE